jgi:hypothetical protein
MRSFHSFLILGVVVGGGAVWAMPGCGSADPPCGAGGTFCDQPLDGGDPDAINGDEYDPFGQQDGNVDAAPPCTGIACNIVNCNNGNHTTISGTVYDPAGRNPLYNVYVYIPNSDLLAIPTGPVCTSCQAPATGSPIVGVQTDPQGHFTLTDVPVGANVPLVMQLGKWRKVIKIPQVTQCVNNPVGNRVADPKNNGYKIEKLTRMPQKQAETDPMDNIPKIAMAGGSCDSLECLVRKIGVADSEFTTKTGRIHLYNGNGGGTVSSGYTSTDAYTTLWNSKTELAKYDIVMNSCECNDYPRNGSQATIKAYVDGGGRFFGTHYHYNWFSAPDGPADWQGTAQWLAGGSFPSAPWYIDTSFPKGAAFDKWIQNITSKAIDPNAVPPPPGQITLTYSNNDVSNIVKPTTRWIYYGDKTGPNYGTAYLSFNTPVKTTVDKQCGRAVFSDLHVSSGSGGEFPAECTSNGDILTQQEAALEYLFFDLSSCVGDDTKPPPPPPPN